LKCVRSFRAKPSRWIVSPNPFDPHRFDVFRGGELTISIGCLVARSMCRSLFAGALVKKDDRFAVASRTSGSPDPVDVRFTVVRQIEVETRDWIRGTSRPRAATSVATRDIEFAVLQLSDRARGGVGEGAGSRTFCGMSPFRANGVESLAGSPFGNRDVASFGLV